jgi:hypothetical protein
MLKPLLSKILGLNSSNAASGPSAFYASNTRSRGNQQKLAHSYFKSTNGDFEMKSFQGDNSGNTSKCHTIVEVGGSRSGSQDDIIFQRNA